MLQHHERTPSEVTASIHQEDSGSPFGSLTALIDGERVHIAHLFSADSGSTGTFFYRNVREDTQFLAAAWNFAVCNGLGTGVMAAIVQRELELERDRDAAREQAEKLAEAAHAWDLELSEYCDGPERDAVRAAYDAWVKSRDAT